MGMGTLCLKMIAMIIFTFYTDNSFTVSQPFCHRDCLCFCNGTERRIKKQETAKMNRKNY